MDPQELQFIECRGSPREMGRQYGEQARPAIRANMDLWMGSRFKLTDTFAGNARAVLSRFVPEVLEELEGLAEGSGFPLASVLLMNHVNAFDPGRPPSGCTALALAQSDQGPVLGKNNDIVPDPRRHLIRKCVPDRGLAMIHVANAGWLSGLDAMNAAGLASSHCSVGSAFDRSGLRLDFRLWMYHLMRRCRRVDELLEQVDGVPLTGKGFNVVVLDAAGRACVLEAALPLVARRDLGKEFVYATNHFASAPLMDADGCSPEERWVSIYRFGYLRWIERTAPPRTVADVAGILRSHDPWGPCRHGGPHVSSTVWSMIGLPAAGRLSVTSGAPCCNDCRHFGV